MYILLNKYFCCTVVKKQTIILTGCREYLYISVCTWYEDSVTQMKRWSTHKVTRSGDVLRVFMSSLIRQWWRLRERANLNTARRCGIYFRVPKIQCTPSKWTKRFFDVLRFLLDVLKFASDFCCIWVTRVTWGIVSALIRCVLLWAYQTATGGGGRSVERVGKGVEKTLCQIATGSECLFFSFPHQGVTSDLHPLLELAVFTTLCVRLYSCTRLASSRHIHTWFNGGRVFC